MYCLLVEYAFGGRAHTAVAGQGAGNDKPGARVLLGAPEVAHLDREQWWLCGSSQPWPEEAADVLSARLELPKPRLHVVPPDEPA
jgi:hypothetical protein